MMGIHHPVRRAAVLLLLALVTGCGSGDDKEEETAFENRAVSAVHSFGPDLLEPGLPKVLDFGRGTCVPCRKMTPILEGLAREFDGRVVIKIIDIGEAAGRDLSRAFDIRLIPTQIFIDAEGGEVWRHEGFLPRDEIVGWLRQMGIDS